MSHQNVENLNKLNTIIELCHSLRDGIKGQIGEDEIIHVEEEENII